MKKIFLFAAALAALVACKPEQEQPTVSTDKISVAPQNKTIDGQGGTVKVMVTSSGDWTFAAKDGAKYDWVSADKTSGKDGDIVEFTVAKNGEEKKTAEFVFTCGKAEDTFTLVSMPGELPVISLTSDAEVPVNYQEGKFTVTVQLKKLTMDDITVETSAEWLRKLFIGEGETADAANIDLGYDALEGLEPREATVTISGKDAEPVTVKLIQAAKPTLVVTPASANLDPKTAGTLEVTVSANVEYEISYKYDEGVEAWLSDHATEGNIEKWNYSAYTEEGKQRKVEITFTEKNPADGAEALTAVVNARQSNLKYALNIANARVASPETWPNGDVMKVGKVLTVEMLAYHPGALSNLGYLFGTERRFLIRHGDTWQKAQWELVCARTTKETNGENAEWKLQVNTSANYLPADKWFHVAVTMDGTTAKIYLNGEVVAEGNLPSDFKDVDFTEQYTGNNTTQKLYLGWGYSNGRDWKGQVAELRIWNRALAQEEIKAEGHYFSVPADSEGLVGYWKMDEGEGSVIYDSTSNANNFEAQNMPNGYSWAAGANWEELEAWPPVIE